MMSRADLEARVWQITGRELTGTAVDAILDACEEYAADRGEHQPRLVLPRISSCGSELWPVIGLLADALLGEPDAGEPEPAPLRLAGGAA